MLYVYYRQIVERMVNWKGFWQEAIQAFLKTLSWNLLEGTEEKRVNSYSIVSVSAEIQKGNPEYN